VPAGVEKVSLRSDSAGYQTDLMKYCASGAEDGFCQGGNAKYFRIFRLLDNYSPFHVLGKHARPCFSDAARTVIFQMYLGMTVRFADRRRGA
jgi:hypothetical protein